MLSHSQTKFLNNNPFICDLIPHFLTYYLVLQPLMGFGYFYDLPTLNSVISCCFPGNFLLLALISRTISGLLYNSYGSSLKRLLKLFAASQCGPYIFVINFLSNCHKPMLFCSDIVHVLLAYITTGLIIVSQIATLDPQNTSLDPSTD